MPFRMILTPTGARLAPAKGETPIFSYEKKSALVVDATSRSYFLLPLELVPRSSPPAWARPARPRRRGDGDDQDCSEPPATRWSSAARRRASPCAPGARPTRLEPRLRPPRRRPRPPLVHRRPAPVFVGLPLAGSLDIEGAHPYRASWEITKLSRDESADEDFALPGYRMDLERILALQQSGKR